MINFVFICIAIQVLFLIPSYFIYRKFLRKKIGNNNITMYSWLATLLMPFLYTVLILGISYGIIDPILRSKKFNSEDWIQNVDSRYRMVNYLIKNETLQGKTKEEVIVIMGEEFDENCWTNNTICYKTPEPDNYAILDHYELIIVFNDQNKVESVLYINI